MLNIALWSLRPSQSRANTLRSTPGPQPSRYLQLLLSAVYVAGCAFRSVLPVVDIPRLVLIDSRLSSVLVGRSVATVAELCFAAQWALLLHRRLPQRQPIRKAVALALLPLIVLAEGCSWYAVLTTGNALTRSRIPSGDSRQHWWWPHAGDRAASISDLYAPSDRRGRRLCRFHISLRCPDVLVAMACRSGQRTRLPEHRRRLVDVSQTLDGVLPLGGLEDEVPWMSLYFTFGVWSSIWLVYASLALGHSS